MYSAFKNNSFLKSISTLASGSIIAQLIILLTAPIITRLYTPEEFGTFTYLLSITSIFVGVINGRYEQSIIVEKDEQRIYALVKLSVIIGCALSVLVTLGYVIFILVNDTFSEKKASVPFIFFILLSYTLINILTSYNNRMKEFKVMSLVYVVRTCFQNFGAAAAGFFKLGIIGLTGSYVIGQLFGVKQQGRTLTPHIQKIKKVKVHEMKEVAILHKRQLFYAAPAAFTSSFSYSSITLFIESLFSYTIVGFYSISVRILGLPLSVISGNVSKVFFEAASKEYIKNGNFISSFKKTFLFQSVLALPMVFVMMTYAPFLAKFMFGKEWEVAGNYIIILAPMFGIRFIASTFSPGIVIASKQNVELIIQGLFIASSVIAYLVSKYLGLSIEEFLMMISLSYSIIYLFFLLALYNYSRGKLSFLRYF